MAIPLTCRRVWPAIAGFIVVTGFCPGAAVDPPDVTYQSKVSEVQLSFSVTDQNNHGVATLEAGDFAVVDEDIIVRHFKSFTRTRWTKMEIAILVDASGSMAPHFTREAAALLELVSESSGIPDENISLFSFQGLQPALVCAGDCRASHGAEQIPAPRSGGLTPLFDTIVFAADYLGRHSDNDTEKILILFSDGQDTISRTSLDDAIDATLGRDIRLYSIDLNPDASSRGSDVLSGLANASGGGYFLGGDASRRAMDAILEGFQASYVVAYRLPSSDAGFHPVRILPTHNSNLQFRSRSGYFYSHIR
ncbi:MAG TPA: VWA domain-containing protein [Candidatus Sulfotelmatobacter sp.]|nr:VWA domain-containing protein [Candidatus Sulfotelmatobacter sp.]